MARILVIDDEAPIRENLVRFLMLEGHQRCGGYVVHSTLADALQSMAQPISQNLFSAPPLTQGASVNRLLPHLDQGKIVGTISQLASWRNRYYTTTTGVQSADWVAGQWQTAHGVSHLVARRLVDVTPWLGRLMTASRDFH